MEERNKILSSLMNSIPIFPIKSLFSTADLIPQSTKSNLKETKIENQFQTPTQTSLTKTQEIYPTTPSDIKLPEINKITSISDILDKMEPIIPKLPESNKNDALKSIDLPSIGTSSSYTPTLPSLNKMEPIIPKLPESNKEDIVKVEYPSISEMETTDLITRTAGRLFSI